MGDLDDKVHLLADIRRTRAAWEATLARLDNVHMTQPGVCGEWSVMDLISHLAWFEREIVGLLQTRQLAGSELWALPPDQRNAAIFEQNQRRALAEVRAEAHQVFETLLREVEALVEEDLRDPSRFTGMPPDWQSAKLIAENTCEHYPEHTAQVLAWLATQSASSLPEES